ncbi:MAG: translation initiation factor IF-2 N-terminal domain-containing protein, partial [Cyanobium sp.]
MTSSGKVRIYELSRDLGLDNKDVLDAAEKLRIAARSHSSSISDDEADRIRALISRGNGGKPAPASGGSAAAGTAGKAILSVKKAAAEPAVVKPAPGAVVAPGPERRGPSPGAQPGLLPRRGGG